MQRFLSVLLLLSLSGCGIFDWFDDDSHKPTPLAEITASVKVTPVWTAKTSKADRYFFSPALFGTDVVVAGNDGSVSRLEGASGKEIWKISLDENLSAGVGADAGTIAVATVRGALVVLNPDGKERWRAQVGGEILSPPAVGDGVVVVRTTDGRLQAYDSGTGSKRWVYSRQSQPLVLRIAPGVVISSGALYAGLGGGRLVAMTDSNGGLKWDIAVSLPKGATELERVADVTGTPVLVGRQICVATFQGRAGCFDIANGSTIWTHPASTTSGIGVDSRGAYLSNEKSEVEGFARLSGSSLWKNDKMTYRRLGTPVPFKGSVVVGDYAGFVHWLSEADGSIVARVPTDGSTIKVPPVVSADGQRLLVQTADGGVFAFTAE